MTKYVVDTNSLLSNPEIVQREDIIITSMVLRELEHLELKKMDKTLQFQIRRAKREINKCLDESVELVDIKDFTDAIEGGFSKDYADNIIVEYARVNDYGIITNDILMKLKAEALGIEVLEISKSAESNYQGVKDFYYDENIEEHQLLLEQVHMNQGMYSNPFNLFVNEYLIVWDINKPTYKTDDFGDKVPTGGYKEIGTYRFDGVQMTRLKFKDLDTEELGKVSPRNVRQRLAFDLLQNEEITAKVLSGTWGAGKDFLMVAHAIDQIKNHKFDKIVWVRNNVEVKDSNPIGFLPNSMEEKLFPFLAPLMDALGGEEGLRRFIEEGKVEVQHLGFMRGRDIRNSIIYVTEAQANTKAHIQLLLSRVSEGSQIWINGDAKQTDSDKFERDNGINAVQKLAGDKLYGQVTLDIQERSATSRLASLLDD